MTTPFRLPPKLPVQAYQTYQIWSPVQTHTRRATCAEVECPASLKGWTTVIDVATPLGARQANYIRLASGRHFTATEAGTLVTFTFPAGQRCFAEHRVRLDRPELFLRRGGDWRAQTSEPVHLRAIDWIDDFANHQIGLAERIKRG